MITAHNTPKTTWIRDSGTIVETTTGIMIDESGNFFVDELGFNLLDSISSDGETLPVDWDSELETTTSWANVLGGNIPLGANTRTTAQGDTRTTAQGDTRITSEGQSNDTTPTAWGSDEYA